MLSKYWFILLQNWFFVDDSFLAVNHAHKNQNEKFNQTLKLPEDFAVLKKYICYKDRKKFNECDWNEANGVVKLEWHKTMNHESQSLLSCAGKE